MKRQSSTTKNTPRPPSTPTATPSAPTSTPASNSKTNQTAKADTQRELKPTPDDIRRRAYEIYLDRQHKGTPGTPVDDWAKAERELQRR